MFRGGWVGLAGGKTGRGRRDGEAALRREGDIAPYDAFVDVACVCACACVFACSFCGVRIVLEYSLVGRAFGSVRMFGVFDALVEWAI